MLKNSILSIFLTTLVGCTGCNSTTAKNEDFSQRVVETQLEALQSSVLVEYGIATGSGFIIDTFLNEEETERCYKVITAAHVMKEAYGTPLTSPSIRFTKDGEHIIYRGDVTFRDVYKDVALITVWTDNTEKLCLPFRITKDNKYLKYTTKVYMVSFPQGMGPMLTEGIISGISILDWDKNAYTTTAQSAPGSSGGAIIHMETGEVLGLLKAVVVHPGSPHLFGWQSIVAPASDLRDLVAWSKDEVSIIPGEPRGQDANSLILLFTPKQEPKAPLEKK